jgi:hypothetical protein
MTADVYSKFLTRLGHTVIQTGPTFWFDVSFRVWQAFRFHRPVDPLAGGIRHLLVRHRFMAARFPVSVGLPGYDTGRLVCDTKDYDLSSLTKKARNQTRRGLESFEIREVSPVDLSEAGVEAHVETLSRQQRVKPRQLIDRWKRFCREAAQTPGFSAWAAYGKERLAAYLVSFQIEDCCNYSGPRILDQAIS